MTTARTMTVRRGAWRVAALAAMLGATALTGCAGVDPGPAETQRSVGDERPDADDDGSDDGARNGTDAPPITTAALPEVEPADTWAFDNGFLTVAVPAPFEPYHDEEWAEQNGHRVFYGDRIPGTADPAHAHTTDALSFVAVYQPVEASLPDDPATSSLPFADQFPAGDPRVVHTRHTVDVPGAELAEAYTSTIAEGFRSGPLDGEQAWFPARTWGTIRVFAGGRSTTVVVHGPPGDEGLALVASVARSIRVPEG